MIHYCIFFHDRSKSNAIAKFYRLKNFAILKVTNPTPTHHAIITVHIKSFYHQWEPIGNGCVLSESELEKQISES